MRWPWSRRRDVLDDQLDWMRRSVALIREVDPEAAHRLVLNIHDRLALPHREADPMDRPRDVIALVMDALERAEKKIR